MDETAASRVLIVPCVKVLNLEYVETPTLQQTVEMLASTLYGRFNLP
jgi:hypothetical protein